MVRATEGSGVELVRPLWQIPRNELKQELVNKGFDIVVSCASIEKTGQAISNDSVGKSYYYVYEKIKEINGIDWTGEASEFHTMVLDAPFFSRHIQFKGSLQTDDIGHYLYLNFDHIQLVGKQ
jgi:diphthamide synthase (EF-2-diphthine--ammonia ligase)